MTFVSESEHSEIQQKNRTCRKPWHVMTVVGHKLETHFGDTALWLPKYYINWMWPWSSKLKNCLSKDYYIIHGGMRYIIHNFFTFVFVRWDLWHEHSIHFQLESSKFNHGSRPGSNLNRGWHEMYQWVLSDEEIYFKSQTVGRIKLEIEFPFQNLTLIQPHLLKIAEYTVIIWKVT